MAKSKWISNNQLEFLMHGEHCARTILKDPKRFEISPEDAQRFADAMARCRAAFTVQSSAGRSSVSKTVNDQARAEAVAILRQFGNLVRANPRIDAATKILIGIEERAKPSAPLPCPQEPPHLWFMKALHHGISAEPMHELRFSAACSTKSKPPGAVRLELFADYIGLNDPVPDYAHQNYGGFPQYQGYFASSPFVYKPRMPEVPMIILYWARWVGGGDCDFGPFCKTVVGGLVGGMRRFAKPIFGETLNARAESLPILESPSENRDVTIRIAVLEMQRKIMLPQGVPEETKRLAGPEAA